VQELFGGKRYQTFSVKDVSHTLAEVWLKGMLAETTVESPARSRNSNNGQALEKSTNAGRNHAK
jgi:hypothetical protein